MGSLPHNLYKIKFRQIKGLVRTANTYVVLPIYLTSSSTLRLLLRSSHLSLMVSTVISIFYMRTPRHAQRNRVICPRSQSQSHDSNPGLSGFSISALNHYSVLPLSRKCSGHSKFFKYRAMSLPSLDREGFFPRKDFMFIIKEQYSINLAPLKLRTSVCQEKILITRKDCNHN